MLSPKVFLPHLDGMTIKAKRKTFLAIPTKAAGKKANPIGAGPRVHKRPSDFPKRVVIITKGGKKGVIVRQTKTRSTILFHLVRRVHIRKRLNFKQAADRAERRVAGTIGKIYEERRRR